MCLFNALMFEWVQLTALVHPRLVCGRLGRAVGGRAKDCVMKECLMSTEKIIFKMHAILFVIKRVR